MSVCPRGYPHNSGEDTGGNIRDILDLLGHRGSRFCLPAEDAAVLKSEFGKDLVFWGGGVDTQKVLPFGTPEQVRSQVRRQCEILGEGGGFVFNTIHNVQANVPAENIIALVDELRKMRGL